jgi:hypothetical protein
LNKWEGESSEYETFKSSGCEIYKSSERDTYKSSEYKIGKENKMNGHKIFYHEKTTMNKVNSKKEVDLVGCFDQLFWID